MTDLSLFRVYEPHELGKDGYPHVWDRGLDLEEIRVFGSHDPVAAVVVGEGDRGVKDVVRMRAGYRCERCGHPYRPGCGIREVAGRPPLDQAAAVRQCELWAESATDEQLKIEVKQKGDLWSPCDERCTHGGPVRWRVRGVEKWINAPKVGLAEIRVQLRHNVEIQAAWRVLTVHHLNGHKHDLRWWNLISVCQRCHLWLQQRVVMPRVYPYEHDDYFKPYAAGWYAYVYLGETVTREQAMERLDELLALERMA